MSETAKKQSSNVGMRGKTLRKIVKDSRYLALQNQIRRLDQRLQTLRLRSYRYTWVRLIVFFVGLTASAAILYFGGWQSFWLGVLVSLLLFGLAVTIHRQINTGIDRHEIWKQIKQAQLARMTLNWQKIPALSRFDPRYTHPFEADLDLVGPRSLHRLMDVAVSHEGSHLLREWLTTSAPGMHEVTRRRQLVRELIPLSLFRDKLILNAALASGTRKMWDAHRLTTWLEQYTDAPSLRVWLLVFGGLAALNLAVVLLHVAGIISPAWYTLLVFYFALLLPANSRLVGETFQQATALQAALHQLGVVFSQIESFSYRHTPHLKILCAPFLDRPNRPSKQLGRISRIATAAGLRQNPMMWLLLNLFFPWDIFTACQLNRYKANLAQYAPGWMAVWFELEALSSLANLAYLNPDYTLPAIVELNNNGSSPVFRAEALGHPLIADAERVSNSFSIAGLGDMAIITGSNMAGKSTFLRTVGINLALAFAGGPVNAQLLHTGLFRLFTCIKVTDSVTNGISYFYAEVKRLRALLSALEDEQSLPLFFFIDEIFRGTNNRERFIGSQAYVQNLAGKRGVGLISTHDLELAKLADQLAAIDNFHFKDDVTGDRMIFDYILQPGPCPTTNALKIMQLEGLPVPENKGLG